MLNNTNETPETERLITALAQISRRMAESGDKLNAAKIEQVSEKLQTGKFAIAFCGHFSAGKSSWINRLCGHALLPSSPIPTSANIVRITNGEEAAYVRHHGSAEASKIPLDRLDEYCKNGNDIETVDISYPIEWLGDHTELLDTPGIDSTDEAHRLSTESALHLADVVFYVTDYNHVQSEINFTFIKQLSEWGKPLYLIVNQIDKHREEELSFETYRNSVADALQEWDAVPQGIVYLTLKQPGHPLNEADKLYGLLGALQASRQALKVWSAKTSAEQLIRDHANVISARNEPLKSSYASTYANSAEAPEIEIIRAERNALLTERSALAQAAETFGRSFKREAAALLDNANIMPANTRDLAGQYLQSRRPGFKAGWFAGSKKTTEEIERRLNAFAEQTGENITAHIETHLREMLRNHGETNRIDTESSLDELSQVRSKFTPDWLGNLVQPGSVISDEYTMNYTRRAAAEIKETYRLFMANTAEQIAEQISRLSEDQLVHIEEQAAKLSERIEAYEQLQKIEQVEKVAQEQLEALLASSTGSVIHSFPSPDHIGDMSETFKLDENHGITADVSVESTPQEDSSAQTPDADPAMEHANPVFAAASIAYAKRMREAAFLLSRIPAMQQACRNLSDKAEQLENKRFTIALFGAFSAGKSSFANALIGEGVLPVSPNPTTASITKIMPPTSDWPSATTKVRMKSRQAIEADVRGSIAALGLEAGNFESMLALIRSLTPDMFVGRGKAHYRFLNAVSEGWREAEPMLGSELRTDAADFAAFVAEERKSCFVERIEYYYDCSLTRQGITLVDTPGADSINARHTGVSFEYIKNADAIIYVTYYNHAFSEADREFLLQLGRVKDSFELDKMFFVINASDLADSDTELTAVVRHVEEGLISHGIRNPRVFPLSSIQALKGKQSGSLTGDSPFGEFERRFYYFAAMELEPMAVDSAAKEMNRAAELLDEVIANAREDESVKERKKEDLHGAVARIHSLFETRKEESLIDDISREIRDLLYYVKQRCEYRFGETFQASFNPAYIRDDQGDSKRALRASWQQLVSALSVQVSQEILATTLRAERFIERFIRKRNDELIGAFIELLPSFDADSHDDLHLDTPFVEETLEVIPEWDDRLLFHHYRNGKQFFEGGGKESLRNVLEPICIQMIALQIDKHQAILSNHYDTLTRKRLSEHADRLRNAALEHASGLLQVLEQPADMEQLTSMRDKLSNLL